MKGVSQSFEFVGRIKAIEKVRAARPRRRLPREGAVPREARTSRRASCSTRSRRCSSRRWSTRPRPTSPSPRPSVTNARLQYERSLELSKRNFSPQSAGRPEQGGARHAAGPRSCRPGGADAGRGQSRLHRHPLADRRPHRPHRLHGRQSGQPGERRAGDHRQPGPDLRAVPGERARARDDPRGAAQGGRRPRQDRDPRPPAERPGVSASRRLEPHRSAGRPADRHADHAGDHPQPRAAR